jgi:hypothetical protein
MSVQCDARSLLHFGDQHISKFYRDYDLMIIDYRHVPEAAAQVIVFRPDKMMRSPKSQPRMLGCAPHCRLA